MKTSGVVSLVIGIHVVGIGVLLLAPGCGTRHPKVERPSAPPMPPRTVTPATPSPALPPPARFTPPPATLPEEQPVVYVVQPGDSVGRIAQRHGVTAREIAELNKLERPDRIRIGQKLVLPPNTRQPAAPRTPAPAPATRVVPPGAVEYRVMPGDSLSKIAHQYGIKISELREANGITGDRLDIGQRLIVPNPKKTPGAASRSPVAVPTPPAPPVPPALPPATPPAARVPAPSALAPTAAAAVTPPAAPTGEAPNTVVYTVRENETIRTLSRDFIVTEATLRRLNSLAPDADVRPGQKILIPLSE